ncbi:hypothetical protein [Streptomyces sp. NPDC101132]|uniref:SPW repeat domain-containing protein n=1 Tax=Streptomyces sp. NPDC101132 TaxID=3366110 RepID=UPI00381F3A8C
MSVYRHQQHLPARQDTGHVIRQGLHDQVLGLLMLGASVALWAVPMATQAGPKDAQVNEMIVGTVLTLIVGHRLFRGGGVRSDVAVGALGLWMLASPFVLDWQKTSLDTASRILDLTTGAVLVIAAGASLLLLAADHRATRREGKPAPAGPSRQATTPTEP